MNRFFKTFVFLFLHIVFLTHAFAENPKVIDPKINYYEILGFNLNLTDLIVRGDSESLPSPIEISKAYKKKVADAGIDFSKRRLVETARSILSDPNLTSEYLSRYAQNIKWNHVSKESIGNYISGVDPKSVVGFAIDPISKTGAVLIATFNSAHNEKPVEYFRENSRDNIVEALAESDIDVYSSKSKSNPLESLNSKWLSWDTTKDIRAIEKEFQKIAEEGPKTSIATKAYHERVSFLRWWFAQPESLLRPDLIIDTLNILENSNGLFSDSIYLEVLVGSVREKQWRTKNWLRQVYSFNKGYWALSGILGDPDLIVDVPFVESVLKMPEFDQEPVRAIEAIISNPGGVIHPEWIRRALNSSEGKSKSTLNLIMMSMIKHDYWLNTHPEIITEILRAMTDAQMGSRLNVARVLLTRPEAILHPEWLEILIKTDANHFLTLTLNQILALDKWYYHPYLRTILKGKAPSVESLKNATWLKVAAAESVIASARRSSQTNAVGRACMNIFK